MRHCLHICNCSSEAEENPGDTYLANHFMSAFSVKTKCALLRENNAEVTCGSFATVLILIKVQVLTPENVAVGYTPFLTYIQVIYKTAKCLIKSSKITLKTIHNIFLQEDNHLEEDASHRNKNFM